MKEEKRSYIGGLLHGIGTLLTYQNRARVAPPDISDYSAHVVLFFCSGQK